MVAGPGHWSGQATWQQTRVLRGGSWNNNHQNARAASRIHNNPDNRNNNRGVRVVCVGPCSSGPSLVARDGVRRVALARVAASKSAVATTVSRLRRRRGMAQARLVCTRWSGTGAPLAS
ncbi:MAG: hypothetical protein H0T73_01975, partial [Ardenticatenales bacterium]|nr:hypothetical protein [Ardenticatenales bacterium]